MCVCVCARVFGQGVKHVFWRVLFGSREGGILGIKSKGSGWDRGVRDRREFRGRKVKI